MGAEESSAWMGKRGADGPGAAPPQRIPYLLRDRQADAESGGRLQRCN